jgi:Zn-dependent M28 family amino/carboxypeptidase
MTRLSNAATKARRHEEDTLIFVPSCLRGSVIRRLAVALVLSSCFSAAYVVSGQAQGSSTRQHVQTLASEKLDGRLTGSAGERLAADYIVSQLERVGAKPLPGQADYRLPFEFTAGSRDSGSTVEVYREERAKVAIESGTVTGGISSGVVGPEGTSCYTRNSGSGSRSGCKYNARGDVQALSFSDNTEVTGPLVFAGYGLVVPDSQDFGYDSYVGLDVKDKIVLVLRYFPEDAEQKVKGILARYSDLRYKAMAARQRGAKAMIVVTGPRSPNAGETVPMSFDTAIAGSGIAAASISAKVAAEIFRDLAGPEKALAAAQQSLDSGNPHVAGFEIPGVTVTLRTSVARERQEGRNIVAYLPATGPTTTVQKSWVALGAHYDHLGHGTNGNSLARKEESGQIHLGADDNASGTAAVLAAGETLARQQRRRNVLLAFWSGEELGLLGSAAFAAQPPVPIDQLAAYLNFDMVGRMQDNKLGVQAAGTSPSWSRLLEQANIVAGFDLQVQSDPYQPTDVATFNLASVPCLAFFTGTHVDYHRPTDTADKIDYEDLDRVVAFAADITRRLGDLVDPPPFTKVDQPSQAGSRAGVRVFTGTIPDYTSEVKGLLLGGVIGGGPAEEAGLQKGDVIVEIAGQSIANIYDYTYALELLKIGQSVKVAYMRAGKRIETQLTPSARK